MAWPGAWLIDRQEVVCAVEVEKGVAAGAITGLDDLAKKNVMITPVLTRHDLAIEPDEAFFEHRHTLHGQTILDSSELGIDERSPTGKTVGEELLSIRENTDRVAPCFDHRVARLAPTTETDQNPRRSERDDRERIDGDTSKTLPGHRRHHRHARRVQSSQGTHRISTRRLPTVDDLKAMPLSATSTRPHGNSRVILARHDG